MEDARAKAEQDLENLRMKNAGDLRAREEAHAAQVAALEGSASHEMGEARSRIAEVESHLASTRDEREDVGRRLSAAQAKQENDRRSLERAKDALAVALAQIEETEAKSS